MEHGGARRHQLLLLLACFSTARAWVASPGVRGSARLPVTRGRPPRLAGPPIVEKAFISASEFLGKLTAQAFKRAKRGAPGPLPLKRFRFSASGRHIRTIAGRLDEYMSLPVESYALFDPKLMRRLGDDVFELSLPLVGPTGAADVQPTLRLRVLPDGEDGLRIDSVGASLLPAPVATLEEVWGPNATAAERTVGALERSLRTSDLGFNATLRWVKRRRPGPAGEARVRLATRVAVALEVELPPPFSHVPSVLLQGAMGLVMKSVIELVLPQARHRRTPSPARAAPAAAPLRRRPHAPPPPSRPWPLSRAHAVRLAARARLRAVGRRLEGPQRAGGHAHGAHQPARTGGAGRGRAARPRVGRRGLRAIARAPAARGRRRGPLETRAPKAPRPS